MITVLRLLKVKIILTEVSFLHNGCALEVIMKMYRLHFYYQVTEQLHSKTIGPVMTPVVDRVQTKAGSSGIAGSRLWDANTLRSSLMPSGTSPNLLTPNLSQQFPR